MRLKEEYADKLSWGKQKADKSLIVQNETYTLELNFPTYNMHILSHTERKPQIFPFIVCYFSAHTSRIVFRLYNSISCLNARLYTCGVADNPFQQRTTKN